MDTLTPAEYKRLLQAASKPDLWTDSLLSLFHHLHHEGKPPKHETHHCGGDHPDPEIDYTIEHCPCGLHTIDKPEAVGHATRGDLDLLEVTVEFKEKCPDGGWHIESGKLTKSGKTAYVLVRMG